MQRQKTLTLLCSRLGERQVICFLHLSWVRGGRLCWAHCDQMKPGGTGLLERAMSSEQT